jgi:hypothetical protein
MKSMVSTAPIYYDVPDELWLNIATSLPLSCLRALSGTCHHFHRIVSMDTLWALLCAQYFSPSLPRPKRMTWRELFHYVTSQPESLLDFTVIRCNGGRFAEFYSEENLHVNDGHVYCSRNPREVALVSVPSVATAVLVTQVVCKNPFKGFTSPVRAFGCVFQFNSTITPPPGTYPKHVVLPQGKEYTVNEMDGHVELRFGWSTGNLLLHQLSRPQLCTSVLTQLHYGKCEENIDVQYLGFIGKVIDGPKAHPVLALSARLFHHKVFMRENWAEYSDREDSEADSDTDTEMTNGLL